MTYKGIEFLSFDTILLFVPVGGNCFHFYACAVSLRFNDLWSVNPVLKQAEAKCFLF